MSQPVDRLDRLDEDRELLVAIHTLSEFVIEQADNERRRVGFGWEPAPDAPNTYDGLQAAFGRSLLTGEPLPVSDEHSSSVIFTDDAVNYAMRFWHDVSHIRNDLSFDLVDELELCLRMLDIAELNGFRKCGLVYKMLHADMSGQAYMLGVSNEYGHQPSDADISAGLVSGGRIKFKIICQCLDLQWAPPGGPRRTRHRAGKLASGRRAEVLHIATLCLDLPQARHAERSVARCQSPGPVRRSLTGRCPT